MTMCDAQLVVILINGPLPKPTLRSRIRAKLFKKKDLGTRDPQIL